MNSTLINTGPFTFISCLNLAYVLGEKNVKMQVSREVKYTVDNSRLTPLLILSKKYFGWDAEEQLAYRQDVYKLTSKQSTTPLDKAEFYVLDYEWYNSLFSSSSFQGYYSEYQDQVFAKDTQKFLTVGRWLERYNHEWFYNQLMEEKWKAEGHEISMTICCTD